MLYHFYLFICTHLRLTNLLFDEIAPEKFLAGLVQFGPSIKSYIVVKIVEPLLKSYEAKRQRLRQKCIYLENGSRYNFFVLREIVYLE